MLEDGSEVSHSRLAAYPLGHDNEEREVEVGCDPHEDAYCQQLKGHRPYLVHNIEVLAETVNDVAEEVNERKQA